MARRAARSRRAALTERALEALSIGQLSAESVLRAAVSDVRFQNWLERRLSTCAAGEPRAVRVRRRVTLAPAIASVLLARARARFTKVPDVVGISWGTKYRAGRPSGDRALVVWVKRKRAPDQVDLRQLLPRRFSATVAGKTHTVPVDVQRLAVGAKHSANDLRAGKGVAVRVGSGSGTLSAFLDPAASGRALISGHVAVRTGRPVFATLPDGTRRRFGMVHAIRRDEVVDAALVTEVPPTDAGIFTFDPTSVRDLSADDVGVVVRVLRPAGVFHAAIDAVDAPADFGRAGAMRGLVRLDQRVSEAGDSGSAVVDFAGRVIGFIVGYAVVQHGDGARSHTFLVTARSSLHVLRPG